MDEISQELYQMILDDLHITFTPDVPTEHRLKQKILDGIAYLRENCDPNPDCAPGGKHAALLKEFVLRADSGAGSTFAGDFAKEIRQHRVAFDVDGYAEAMQYGDAEG